MRRGIVSIIKQRVSTYLRLRAGMTRLSLCVMRWHNKGAKGCTSRWLTGQSMTSSTAPLHVCNSSPVPQKTARNLQDLWTSISMGQLYLALHQRSHSHGLQNRQSTTHVLCLQDLTGLCAIFSQCRPRQKVSYRVEALYTRRKNRYEIFNGRYSALL